ncbi:hypothetical protein C9426_01570 [Serratia sp. S1B]|nr:hypothetical protein C9426_01570 [Serratia sp. S1B]
MTKKSGLDLQSLSFDAEDLKMLICAAITNGRYRDSEWCTTQPNGPWFACDSYEVNRKEYVENAGKEFVYPYYLKFCINKLGNLVCTFSCHLSS